MVEQLPAIIQAGALHRRSARAAQGVPAMIAAAGDAAGWRYVEFFAANIRNPNTRRADVRARRRGQHIAGGHVGH